jgi:hypothetical protein
LANLYSDDIARQKATDGMVRAAGFKGDGWKVFPLMSEGTIFHYNCSLVPRTAALLSAVPAIRNAIYSVLDTDSHIPEHTGYTTTVLRVQFPVQLPPDTENCGIKVKGETRHWEQGKALVFDDFYKHEAWNRSSGRRAVIYIDADRPIPAPYDKFRDFMNALFSHGLDAQKAEAFRDQEAWLLARASRREHVRRCTAEVTAAGAKISGRVWDLGRGGVNVVFESGQELPAAGTEVEVTLKHPDGETLIRESVVVSVREEADKPLCHLEFRPALPPGDSLAIWLPV